MLALATPWANPIPCKLMATMSALGGGPGLTDNPKICPHGFVFLGGTAVSDSPLQGPLQEHCSVIDEGGPEGGMDG